MPRPPPRPNSEIPDAISRVIGEMYERFYGHARVTARTFVKDDVVLCVLENLMTPQEDTLVAAGQDDKVIDRRVAFQADSEDDFTTAIERITGRRVVAFLSNNQTRPDLATELFFLEPDGAGG